MKKLLSRLVWLPVGAALVIFLFANRQLVAVSLDPISVEDPAIATPAFPLWVWLTAALLAGFFLGAAGMWISGRSKRLVARAEHRELKALKKAAAKAQPSVGAPIGAGPTGAALGASRSPNGGDDLPVLKSTSI